MPRLSIVVPTYQRREDLSRALDAISEAARDAGEIEVVVVIDGSTDGSETVPSARLGGIDHQVVQQSNAGLASARNAGANAATGERIWFLDDDMVIDSVALRTHYHWPPDDGSPAVLSGPCWLTSDSSSPRMINDWHESEYHRLVQAGGVDDPMACHFANTSLPTALLDDLGGFDSSINSYGGEDNEFAIRLLAAGHRVAFLADAAVRHRRNRTARQELRNLRQAMTNQVAIGRMHPAHFDEIFPGYGDHRRYVQAMGLLHRLGIRDAGTAATLLDRTARSALVFETMIGKAMTDRLLGLGQRAAQTRGAVDARADAATMARIIGAADHWGPDEHTT